MRSQFITMPDDSACPTSDSSYSMLNGEKLIREKIMCGTSRGKKNNEHGWHKPQNFNLEAGHLKGPENETNK